MKKQQSRRPFDRAARDALCRRRVAVTPGLSRYVLGDGPLFFTGHRLTLFGESRGAHQLVDLGAGQRPEAFVPRAVRRSPDARARRRLRREQASR